jgi:phosphoglycerate dehydrogenase-like enzyme
LKPFDCKILVNDIIDIGDYAHEHNLEVVEKNVLFQQADLISFHTPLNESTKNLVNKSSILTMKSSVILINTARGGIINEQDLKWALQNNKIGGAALDVFEIEPPEDKELIEFPNLIATPHIAGNSYEAVIEMGLAAINHIINFRQ